MDGDDVNGLTHHEEEAICEEDEEVVELLDDRPMKVHDGLYIGSYMAERNLKSLRKAGITDILQVAQGLFPHHPLVFNYMNIQVQDSPSEDLVVYFSKCFEFINSAINKGGRVLVHCAAGVSRSATVVLGWLMAHHQMQLEAAVAYLKEIRPWVSPNFGFLKQLETYQGISCDMSKWQAWHVVWQQHEQQFVQQQQQQWPQHQQHVLVIPQVSGSNSGSSSCAGECGNPLPVASSSMPACDISNTPSDTAAVAQQQAAAVQQQAAADVAAIQLQGQIFLGCLQPSCTVAQPSAQSSSIVGLSSAAAQSLVHWSQTGEQGAAAAEGDIEMEGS
eukprot:GHRR01001676.1.p1 GENE.GHRR01001676.1~~GHRR01001676.1.p1  ORF type:complete len:332 (+),score=140.31 GHRR01001676.1:246-1241(+)